MRVLLTGAGGFIGSTLAALLRERGEVAGRAIEALALVDRVMPAAFAGATAIVGDLGDTAVLERVAGFRPDVVFHLAAVPGGAAEADYALGRRVNLDASLGLFEALAGTKRCDGPAPVIVYASSVAVYGSALPDQVTPETPLRPPITYGAHKLACEVLLADFTRRLLLDARSLRLPGIVARPRAPSGLTSAFMSDLMHALAAGEPFDCPVSPQATAWWMSARRCAENLLHAAGVDLRHADSGRAWPMPVLRLSIAEVVEALARRYGADRAQRMRYLPQEPVEAVFGRYPRLDDSAARALGLRDDGDADALVQRALAA